LPCLVRAGGPGVGYLLLAACGASWSPGGLKSGSGRFAWLVSQLMSSAVIGSSIASGRGVHHTRRPTRRPT